MVNIRESKEIELEGFVEMEQQPHAKEFVNGNDLVTHKRNFLDRNLIYLSIENNQGELAGYFILAFEPSEKIIEFRRIVIDQSQRGIETIAIMKMESYCRDQLCCKRIWLDVYDDNERGKHIYEKLGYKYFNDGYHNNRKLLFYQKHL